MSRKKHIGSSLDDFLEEEGLLENCEGVAAKRVFVFQLEQELAKQQLSKTELADRMGTSRSSVNRLLDPSQPSTLRSLGTAARALGKHIRLGLV